MVASCIVTADTLITDWQVAAPGELGLACACAASRACAADRARGAPTGASAAPMGLRAELARQGIALELMDLGAACRTFNILVQEERRVAAALFLQRSRSKKKRPKEDTEGESFNQPNNHSKLTDSNNCIRIIFILFRYYCFSSLPSAPCLLLVALPRTPVCVPRHVTHVLDISARGLFIKDFR